MNIGLICYTLSERSGARAPIRLAQSLQKRGHKLTIYSYDVGLDENLKQKLLSNGIEIKVYPVSKNPRIPFPLKGFSHIIRMRFDLIKASHDIISFHSTLPAILAAYFSGKRIITTYYGVERSYSNIREEAKIPLHLDFVEKLKARINDFGIVLLQKFSLILAGKVVSISKFLANEARELFGVKPDVIYLGAESDFFNSQAKTSDEKFILSVSRIVPYKGFDFLINAFNKVSARYPDYKLIIVGSVADQNYLENLKKIANPNVIFKSNITDEELGTLYASCSVYALCDLWVPWALTPLEASFFAKPTVGLNLGALGEIIKDGQNGLLANSLSEFEDKLNQMLSNEKLREVLGKKAREMVTSFNWEKTGLEYEKEFLRFLR